jgi:hypothetical protein
MWVTLLYCLEQRSGELLQATVEVEVEVEVAASTAVDAA